MQIAIQSRAHPYAVEFPPSLAEAVERASVGQKIFALIDREVLRLHATELTALPDARTLALEATEAQKSFDSLGVVFRWLLAEGFRKDSTLLVIGGGVIQDIGGFVASVLFRGIRWRLIATTLLAQCDSCIGSKSSINIDGHKNQLGTFYPPHEVFIVNAVLRTLPPDEIRSGVGEMIKLALIDGPTAWRSLQDQLDGFERSKDVAALNAAVSDCLNIKKRYIEVDEFDRGIRNLLNYGHTFGHAFESATSFGIPHGIAVLLGVSTATYVSEQLGMTPPGYFEALDGVLSKYYRPHDLTLRGLRLDEVFAAMKVDKKNTGDKINCILTRGEGRMERVGLAPEEIFPLVGRYLGRASPQS